MKGTYKGEDCSGQYRATDTWIKRDGRWQLAAYHGSKINVAEPHVTNHHNVEQEIIKLENQVNEAAVKGDVETMSRLMAEDYIQTYSEGNIFTKKEALASYKSGDETYNSCVLDQPKVFVYGNTAVINFRNTVKGTNKGKEENGQYRVTDTWVKRDGRWQVVAFHSSKIKAE